MCTLYQNHIAMTTYNLMSNNQTRYISTDNVVQSAARGFVFFTQGITFDGTVNVSLPVPIMGALQFGNGGTSKITLESDLTFGSTAGTSTNTIKINTTTGYAEINGTGGALQFSSDTFLPSSRAFLISSDVTFDGGGHDIVFGNLMTFSVNAGVKLTIRDAHLRGLKDLNFVGAGEVVFYNTIITLDNDWTFSGNASIGTPTVEFDDFTVIKGFGKKFVYAGGRDLKFVSDAEVVFDLGTTFSWASSRRNGMVMDNIEFGLAGSRSQLIFNGSNFYVPSRGLSNGLRITKGSVFFKDKCNIYTDANTNVNKSLQFGDASSSSNNTAVYVLGGAQLEVDGYVYDAGV